jgi:hypothetical protein
LIKSAFPIHLDEGQRRVGWSDMGFTTTTQAIAVLRNHVFYISHDAGATWTRVRF